MSFKKTIPLLMVGCLTGCNIIMSSSEITNSNTTTSSSIDSTSSNTSNTSSNTSIDNSETSSSIQSPSINDYNSTPRQMEMEEEGYVGLFKDVNFKKGFRVTKCTYGSGESPYHDNKKINLYDIDNNPNSFDWTIAQWSSKYDLMADYGYSHSQDETGLIHTIQGSGKTLDGTFYPSKKLIFDSTNGEMYLECNTCIEYDTPRTGTEPWVHLLLEPSEFTVNNNLVKISEYNELLMECDYEVTKFEDFLGDKTNTSVHAAQFVWYITLQNRNPESKGYGRYIWFGLNLFDNRSAGRKTNLYSAYDAGTGTGIYSPASDDYLILNSGYIPTINQRATARLNVIEYAKKAYDEGVKNGYFDDTTFDDLYVTGGNFGYEVPGTYNIGAKIYSMNIYAK